MSHTHPDMPPARCEPTRRPFLRWTATAALLTLGDCLCRIGLGAEAPSPPATPKSPGTTGTTSPDRHASSLPERSSTVLGRGDKIDVGEKPREIVDRAYQLGHQYEKKHGGCAQCTLAALQDALPFVSADVDVFRAAGCLDGGATPAGVQSCGAFTGAGMVIGCLCGRTRKDTFTGDGKLSHELIRKVYKQFERHYGSVLCKDVREKAKRDCPEVVGRAARWTAEVLLDEFARKRP